MRKRRRVHYLSAQNGDGLEAHHTKESERERRARERQTEGERDSVNLASLPAGPMEYGDDIWSFKV